MVPKHDEILKNDRGMMVAWDTTEVDEKALDEVRAVVRRQATELGQMLDLVIELPDGKRLAVEVKRNERAAQRRRK